MNDELILAQDMLTVIQEWVNYINDEITNERISLGEIITIEEIYELTKEK